MVNIDGCVNERSRLLILSMRLHLPMMSSICAVATLLVVCVIVRKYIFFYRFKACISCVRTCGKSQEMVFIIMRCLVGNLTKHCKPLRLLHPLFIRLEISQGLPINLLSLFDLILGPGGG